MMNYRILAPLVIASSLLVLPDCGEGTTQAAEADLAKIKERELASVRQQISALKKSMDRRAEDRESPKGEFTSKSCDASDNTVKRSKPGLR